MLGAARRIGRGDFSDEVPVVGHDEMAGLAEEFNKMSGQLAVQIDQLRSQRDEIERSVQRIGEAFASGLDRGALLEIVAETAVSACNASYSVIALGGRLGDEVESGEATAPLRDAVAVAEERATRAGEVAEHCAEGACALSGADRPPRRRRARRRHVRRAAGSARSMPPSATSSAISSARPRPRSRTSPSTSWSPSRR